MQDFDNMKAEHPNVMIPYITLIMSSLPEKERDFTDQEENRNFIWCNSGSQLVRYIILELSGTPKYRNGSVPSDIHVEACIKSVSSVESPYAKNQTTIQTCIFND